MYLGSILLAVRPAARPALAVRPIMILTQSFLGRHEGEWAGWQCDFSATGELKPVDDKYLSQTTIDYGMQPAGFELFATELVDERGALHRRFLRFLPAEGCAL